MQLRDSAPLHAFHWHPLCKNQAGHGEFVAATEHPQRLRTLTTLSVPHPEAFGKALRRPDQAIRSSYMDLFRQEGLL